MQRNWSSSKVWGALVGTLLATGLALGWPGGTARANGAPVSIVLSYLNGVSTWGPTGAAGVAELVGREGEVRLTATGLPRLQGERYHLWVVNTTTGERMSLGAFNASESGVAKLDLVLNGTIPDKHWDLALVSVEGETVEPTEPSGRRSIAGRFPVPAASQTRPAELPRTGGAETAEPAPAGAQQVAALAAPAQPVPAASTAAAGPASAPAGAGASPPLPLLAAGLAALLAGLLAAGAAGFGLGRARARRAAR